MEWTIDTYLKQGYLKFIVLDIWNYNITKLQIWSCESWSCLQTIKFQDDEEECPPRLKAALDSTARLGVLYVCTTEILIVRFEVWRPSYLHYCNLRAKLGDLHICITTRSCLSDAIL